MMHIIRTLGLFGTCSGVALFASLVMAQEAAPTATAPVKPATPVAAPAAEPPRISSSFYQQLPVKGSMMFAEKDLAKYYNVVDFFKQQNLLAGGPNQNQSTTPQAIPGAPTTVTVKRTVQAPVFFLSTLVYYSPDDWSLWINKNRIRPSKLTIEDPANPSANFIVREASDTDVVLTWVPENLDAMSPQWKTALTLQDSAIKESIDGKTYQWSYANKDGSIRLDPTNNIVRVTLSPFQSFDSYHMRVAEGKATPTRVEYDVVQAAPPGTVAPADATAAVPTEPATSPQ